MKCAVYTRVSTDNQVEVEFNSCESQEAKILSFIKSQEKMVVFKVYSDPGFTGANVSRPALQRMLDEIQTGKIDLVISYKIDRLTRSPKDFYQLIELFEKNGVDFISVTERFDTSTPSGRLLRNIMLTFAQFERELASERTKDKMHQRAQKGMWNGGIVPFGYRTKDKRLIPNQEEARIIKNIYEIYLSSGSLFKVYDEVKTNGVKDRKGKTFSKSSIFYILRNPVYTSQLKYAGKLYQGIHQPIISKDIFDKAQKLHKEKKRTMRAYKDYTLGGLLKCKECGSCMTPCHTNKKKNGRRKRYYYYRCTKTLKRDWNYCKTKQVSVNRLEDFIFSNLERISNDKYYLDSLMFKLKFGLSGDRTGLEPSGACSEFGDISGETFAQTLQHFVKILPEKKGIEKNLWAKKFIQRVVYSPQEITVSLFYKRHLEKELRARPDSVRVGADAVRPSTRQNKKSLQGTLEGLRMAPRVGLEPTTYWLTANRYYH